MVHKKWTFLSFDHVRSQNRLERKTFLSELFSLSPIPCDHLDIEEWKKNFRVCNPARNPNKLWYQGYPKFFQEFLISVFRKLEFNIIICISNAFVIIVLYFRINNEKNIITPLIDKF